MDWLLYDRDLRHERVNTLAYQNHVDFLINPLEPGIAYLYSLKISENSLGFLIFSGGIDKQRRAVMC